MTFISGHPIINDNLYNSEAFGPSRAKGGLPGDIDTVQVSNKCNECRYLSLLVYNNNSLCMFLANLLKLLDLTVINLYLGYIMSYNIFS